MVKVYKFIKLAIKIDCGHRLYHASAGIWRGMWWNQYNVLLETFPFMALNRNEQILIQAVFPFTISYLTKMPLCHLKGLIPRSSLKYHFIEILNLPQ
jgi:hypothetical protein